MTEIETCRWCATPLVINIDGNHMRFKAHDAEFCLHATRQRVLDLQRALTWQAEAFEHAAATMTREFEQYLTEHGLPTEVEKHERAAKLVAMQHLLELPDRYPTGT